MTPDVEDIKLLSPVMFSGDGQNPVPGPMTCPWAIWDKPDGETVQVTFSAAADSGQGVHIRSIMRYPTTSTRRAS